MFFCLWAALFCYVSVRGCRHELVRATCTAFDAASMAEDVNAPCVAAASKHADAAWRACTSPSSSKTLDRTGKRRLANFLDRDDASAVDKQAAPKATIGA